MGDRGIFSGGSLRPTPKKGKGPPLPCAPPRLNPRYVTAYRTAVLASRSQLGTELGTGSLPSDDYILPLERELFSQAFRGGAQYPPSDITVREHNIYDSLDAKFFDKKDKRTEKGCTKHNAQRIPVCHQKHPHPCDLHQRRGLRVVASRRS